VLSEGSFSSFYTLQGWFPDKLKMVTSAIELQRIRVNLLAKMHLDGKQARGGRPPCGATGHRFGRVPARWALFLSSGCLPPLDVSLVCQVGPSRKYDSRRDLLHSSSASSSCFPLISYLFT